jgi:uncharacterized membrane protein
MDDLIIARAAHVVAIVVWIGGLALETMVILPIAASTDAPPGLFKRTEHLFAPLARIAVLVAGASGFYMVYALDAWDRYADPGFWWMHAMTAIWTLFALVLFVLEPWFLHAWFERRMSENSAATMSLIQRLHWILLTVSLITVFGAVAGSHG